MSANCSRCTKLWQEYTEATEHQVRLMQKMPALRGNYQEIQKLESEIEAAAENRERVWDRIQDHECEEHAGPPR